VDQNGRSIPSKWYYIFEELFGTKLEDKWKNLSLLELVKSKDRSEALDEFVRACVDTTVITCPTLVATAADIVPAVTAAMAPFQASVTAQFHNLRMATRNRASYTVSASVAQPLYPLHKFTAGVGPGLPNLPPAPPMGFVVAVAVGAAPPGFPATTTDLQELNHGQLQGLSIMYNDDFGVLPGDDEATTRNKFQSWIRQD
jgi:hypothetical protein